MQYAHGEAASNGPSLPTGISNLTGYAAHKTSQEESAHADSSAGCYLQRPEKNQPSSLTSPVPNISIPPLIDCTIELAQLDSRVGRDGPLLGGFTARITL